MGFLFLISLFNLITLPSCWLCLLRCNNQQHSTVLGKCSHTQGKGYLLRDSLFEKQNPDLEVWSEGSKKPEVEERTEAAGPAVLRADNCKGLGCFLLVLKLNRKLQNRAGRNHPSVVKFTLDHQKMTKLPLYTLVLIKPGCDKI